MAKGDAPTANAHRRPSNTSPAAILCAVWQLAAKPCTAGHTRSAAIAPPRALLARCVWSRAVSDPAAFPTADRRARATTADRATFLGPCGTARREGRGRQGA